MIYKVIFTEEAENDLRNAVGQLERIETAVKGLSQMPERYRVYEKTKWQKRGLRIMPIDHYCVFYIPDKSNAAVMVLRILYSGRDMEKELNKGK